MALLLSACIRGGFDGQPLDMAQAQELTSPSDFQVHEGPSVTDGLLVDRGNIGGDVEHPPPTTLLMADDFDDSELNEEKWWSYTDVGTSFLQEGGHLSFVLPANDTNCTVVKGCYTGIGSWQRFSFVNTRVQVEAVQITNEVLEADTGLYITVIEAGEVIGTYGVFVTEQSINFGYQPLSTKVWDLINISYDSTNHRFWRIAHQESDNTIRFLTSPDGTRWTTARIMQNQVDLGEVEFSIEAGIWAAVPQYSATFDNFRAEHVAP
ncbi:MAG: hypothetical protein JRH20_20220 [Deltaproteobacteria bacterium]|nr:hypothetical protein [Deltaproteobacteria bacterium]